MAPPTEGDLGTDAGPGGGRDGTGFETAQRDLFEAVGLDVRSRFVDLDHPRVRMHVFETGPPDGDPPLVFVHGTAGFGAFLAPLMARVDGVRMLAFDRPGYGLSGPFAYTEGNFRRTVVDVLAGVLDGMGETQVDVVGHSAGGYAGIAFALAHPDRVRRLVLVGSVPTFSGTRPPVPLRLLTAPVIGRVVRTAQRSGEAGVLDMAAVFGERDAIRDHPALIRTIAAHERDPTSAAAGRSEFGALIAVRGWRPSVRFRAEELQTLRHPTTVVWGDADPLGRPDDVRDGIEMLPDVRFETVASGHIPYLAHPERCARLIQEARARDDGAAR